MPKWWPTSWMTVRRTCSVTSCSERQAGRVGRARSWQTGRRPSILCCGSSRPAFADTLADRWPRIAAVLRDLASMCDMDARLEETKAERFR